MGWFVPNSRASKSFNSKIPGLVISAMALALTGNSITVSPSSAAVTGVGNSLQHQLREAGPLLEINVRRGGVARGAGVARRTAVVGPRGGVASRTVVRRNAVVRPGVVRPGVVRAGVVRPGRWVRPAAADPDVA